MKFFMRIAVVAAILWCVPAVANTAPTTLTLNFHLFYSGIKIAEVTELLSLSDDGGYVIDSHATAEGLAKLLHGDVTRQSMGWVDLTNGLQMTSYYAKRGRRQPQSARFDEAAGELHLKRGNEERVEQVAAPVFDYLTALYCSYILGRVADGKMTITNGWRLREYEYTAGEEEIVETLVGNLRAIPMRRQSPRGERVIWLAKEKGFIPVRSRIDDKGHIVEVVLSQLP